ncbi:hypothetical protein D9613_010973 [Agrocybe pediades]|uniref:Major facilitator superfamily (MFS) profile domain-containing protein n=1 Tax=Agrocybe pediades TaxID=84607 RepID=A0A8H4QLE9_9AGAR|nr:hypothetical protein D9613_010973 [Agrocybe pediades]
MRVLNGHGILIVPTTGDPNNNFYYQSSPPASHQLGRMHREESKPPSSSEDAEKKVADSHPSEDVELPSTLLAGRKLGIVFSAFVLAIFLTYIDQTIISTALPTIASHFDAVSDLSWIAGGYFLPQAKFSQFQSLAYTHGKKRRRPSYS